MSVLSDLAHELGTDPEALRDALFAGDEALQPTYLTTDAAGAVTAEFTGHVRANGLDILADDAATFIKEDRKIRWHRGTFGGSVAVQDVAADTGALTQAQRQVLAPNGEPAQNGLLAQSGGIFCFLSTYADSSGVSPSQAGGTVNGRPFNILNSFGDSSYVHGEDAQSATGLVEGAARTIYTGGANVAGIALVRYSRAADSGNQGMALLTIIADSSRTKVFNVVSFSYASAHAPPVFDTTWVSAASWTITANQAASAIGNYNTKTQVFGLV